MEEKDERRELEKKAQAIIDYFKLITIEKLTINSDYSTFKMLGGKDLYEKTFNNIENGYLLSEYINCDLIRVLGILLNKLSTGSISSIYTMEFADLDWLGELTDLDLDDGIIDTITKYSSKDVYYSLFNKTKISRTEELARGYLKTNIENIKTISKKFKYGNNIN